MTPTNVFKIVRMAATKPTLKQRIWYKYLGRPFVLHVQDHGGDGPPMILLHGLASSSANWTPLIPLLKENYRCITVDLVGFGDSPKPQWYSYTIDDHLRCIRGAIRRLHLHQPYTLLGHSLGSLLATRYAREYHDEISRLVLLSPPVYAPLGTIASRSARQRTSMYLKAYRFIRTHRRINADNFLKLSRIIPLMKFLVLDHDTWVPFTRSLEQCIENQTIIQDIAAVHAPTDIFYGIFDEVVIPYNVKQLAKIKEVALHPLKVNHMVGVRYAKAVAPVLNSLAPVGQVTKITTSQASKIQS